MKKNLLVISFLLLLFGCKDNRTHTINFYYWKTNMSIGDVEQDYFKSLNSTKLYMRFFGVDTQEGAIIPVAKVQPFDAKRLDAEYIPVVFITNRTFLGMQNEHIQVLARNVVKLIDEICSKNAIPAIHDIQIDCDWTESTKQAYFQFLKELESASKKRVTCTIRLHQVKFKDKTGVPPVSKGYLMCYATSDPKEADGKNSILDMGLLTGYTANINDYPLDFDVVLPLSPALLREAKQYLNEQITKDYGIVYYHLDAPFLTKYTLQELR